MDLNLIIGFVGALMILVAFILDQMNIWKAKDIRYDTVNFIGSAILIYYGLMQESYPFVLLNSVWAIISLKDVIKYFIKKAS